MSSDTGPAASEVKKLREAIESVRGVNYGIQHPPANGNGEKKIVWWFMGGMMAVNVAVLVTFIGWIGGAVTTLQTDVAVIKCQLSPDCQKVASNVKP